jgi:hypothetical protein
MKCNQTTNIEINQEEDPCEGVKKSTQCVIESTALTELGLTINATQNEVNIAIQNALVTLSSQVNLQGYTVATLPSTPTTQLLAYVTDADSPSYRTTAVGGGSERVLVFYNGTNWICH